MGKTITIQTLKTLVEQKIKKKVLLKVMWNDEEKLTLFITPNMKVNSFIYDVKDGYIFFDNEGKQIKQEIPCVLPEGSFEDGAVVLNDEININGEPLTKEDKLYLERN